MPTSFNPGPCGVPGCSQVRTAEDCCDEHSRQRPIAGALRNDGVIDWLAIDIAVEGTRALKLTWLERDIAAATILANGHPECEIARRLGRLPDLPRLLRIRELADAIRVERDEKAWADAR